MSMREPGGCGHENGICICGKAFQCTVSMDIEMWCEAAAVRQQCSDYRHRPYEDESFFPFFAMTIYSHYIRLIEIRFIHTCYS